LLLCALGAVLSVSTITGTSALREDAVVEVVAEGSSVYARVATGYADRGVWARSSDGGRSWVKAAAPPGARPWSQVDRRRRFGPRRYEGFEASDCGEELCARVVYDELAGDLSIMASDAGTERWRVERRLVAGEIQDLWHDCSCDLQALGSVVVVRPSPAADEVAVSAGMTHGVLIRRSDGTWVEHEVLGANAPDPPASLLTRAVALGAGAYGAVAIVVGCWLCARKGRPAIGIATIGVIGWIGALLAGMGMGLFGYSLDVFSFTTMILTTGVVGFMALEFDQGFLGTESSPPERRSPPPPPSWTWLPPPPTSPLPPPPAAPLPSPPDRPAVDPGLPSSAHLHPPRPDEDQA
jgi:hypothetical protein